MSLFGFFKSRPFKVEDVLGEEERAIYERTVANLSRQLDSEGFNLNSIIPDYFVLGYLAVQSNNCVQGAVFDDGSLSVRFQILIRPLCKSLGLTTCEKQLAALPIDVIALVQGMPPYGRTLWGLGWEAGLSDFYAAQLESLGTDTAYSSDNLVRYLNGQELNYMKLDNVEEFLAMKDRLDGLLKEHGILLPVDAGMV
jgi:hypothetical protein